MRWYYEKTSDIKLLQSQARELLALGLRLENARKNLRAAVQSTGDYHSMEVLRALDNFNCLNLRWKALEEKHLALRARLGLQNSQKT